MRAAKEWNFLPESMFPVSYNIGSYKSRVKLRSHHHLTSVSLLYSHTTEALWSCLTDVECDVTGSICFDGSCTCPAGQEVAFGGTVCVDAAIYHSSRCVENSQCSRLFSAFECRRQDGEETGRCFCQPGNHYFLGRCWPSVDFGEPCTRDEQCMGSVLRDPYSMRCNETCVCADGYQLRQRGECRKVAYEVGDGCVLDVDCQFAGGACNQSSFTCINSNAKDSIMKEKVETIRDVSVRAVPHSNFCNSSNPCAAPLECSGINGFCVCPVGYYTVGNGNCLAELGSPSTEQECDGLLAQVRDGICRCPNNLFYDEDMRNCVRAARSISDSCVSDANCHTFGASAICGPPQEDNFGVRTCECIPEQAVWDANRQMCRLFASIGEVCEVNSDCLAGELEIQCLIDDDGIGHCACPDDLQEVDGLCLTSGLDLGDPCQADQECTETANTACVSGICSCGNGFQETNGFCAPIIGGVCIQDDDCVIENTICSNETDTCQCDTQYVPYEEECWLIASGFEAECNNTAQCVRALGENSLCYENHCVCNSGYHHRDGSCWIMTGLFQTCARTSECFLHDLSEKVICRNSLCQCSFDYEYSERLHTCVSLAPTARAASSLLIIVISLLYMY
ncbi:prion-like-(Q/N-rich) domain-bearing protein 25 [Achroia grisella]|uniref:prion-like-(Q/N-rich) domain-bearing protein 25 n=1 Tax=Achroia grisella TaxID=688607 RepID=UPI0027D3425C|nr:prion-like-(Q/N-rich) domain-bearing protein 25 [Achroia grisella]